jgi:hypothetical protein
MVENILPLQKAAQYWRYILSQASHSYSYFSFRKFEFINFFHMERIVIEVDESIAKKWRLSSQQRKDEIARQINNQLAEELLAESKKEFMQFLDEISATAQERGLTEEILKDILKDDE